MKKYNRIMDAIQEPLEWMAIGATITVALMTIVM